MKHVKYISAILISLTLVTNADLLSDQLVAHFEFNNNALDTTGNGHDGTVIGASLTSDRFGTSNSAYDFNGSSDFINCGNIIDGFTNFTISAWINIDTTTDSNYMGPWSQSQPTSSNLAQTYSMYTGSAASTFGTVMRWEENGTVLNTRTSHAVPNGEWHFITQIYDGDKIYQYDDAALVNSTVTGEHELNNIWDFNIGRTYAYPGASAHTYYFDGQIDDVRIYDRALTAQEVDSLYAAIPEPSTAILLSVSGFLLFGFRKKLFR